MGRVKRRLNSIRVKLFLTLCIVVLVIILFLILVNNFIFEPFYLYSKQNTLLSVYNNLNNYYNHPDSNININLELEKIALNNSFDIMIKTDEGIILYTSNKDFLANINQVNLDNMEKTISIGFFNRNNILYSNDKVAISKAKDNVTNVNFIMLTGELDNGYLLYIRIPLSSIQESVKISNTFLYLIGGIAILIGGVVVLFISKKFTEPIVELKKIAKKMSNLDFSSKYQEKDVDDEINSLGRSINTMSLQLEKTIKQLRKTNLELEKDVERKSKIDEMRKQFISDVSHELKTPIALIQGYTEGLLENVNTDEESRRFYAEVILDEANKMDTLVKQLLELTKLEYGKREFNNTNFDVLELITEIIRKSKVILEEEKIEVEIENQKPVMVYADEFYIEQVVTNYFTNAIKHAEEIKGQKQIKIKITQKENKIRISIFNTGENIKEEHIARIWNRFYKVDSSRNREKGGTGIGLSLVKAIMNNYGNDFGVINQENGVEFYFELDKEITGEETLKKDEE